MCPDHGRKQTNNPMKMRRITRRDNSRRSSQRGTRSGGCAAAGGWGAEADAGSGAVPACGAGLTVSVEESVDEVDSGCCIPMLLSAVPDVLASQSLHPS